MSIPQAIADINAAIRKGDESVTAFRATVTAVDGGLISIIRDGFTDADTEKYASVTRFPLAVNDVVLCLPVGVAGKPVIIDVIRRSAAASPSLTPLAAAGSTATGSVSGTDRSGSISLSPAGTGITTGAIFELAFAVAMPSTSYRVLMTPASGAARTLGMVVGRSARATDKVTVSTATALTTGQSYVWDYDIGMIG